MKKRKRKEKIEKERKGKDTIGCFWSNYLGLPQGPWNNSITIIEVINKTSGLENHCQAFWDRPAVRNDDGIDPRMPSQQRPRSARTGHLGSLQRH